MFSLKHSFSWTEMKIVMQLKFCLKKAYLAYIYIKLHAGLDINEGINTHI